MKGQMNMLVLKNARLDSIMRLKNGVSHQGEP